MSEGAGDSGSDNGHNATKKANLTPLRVGSGDSSRDKSGKSSKGIDSRGSRSSGPSNNSRGSTPGSGATGDGGFLNKTIDAVLRSPTVLMGTVKKMNPGGSRRSAGGLSGLKLSGRQSVDPYRRAADQAVYRTSTLIHETEDEEVPQGGPGEKGSNLRTIRYGTFPSEGGEEEEEEGEEGGGRWWQKKEKPSLNDPVLMKEDNRVTTSKYNVATFLPIFLFEMFTRVAYLYFLIQATVRIVLVIEASWRQRLSFSHFVFHFHSPPSAACAAATIGHGADITEPLRYSRHHGHAPQDLPEPAML